MLFLQDLRDRTYYLSNGVIRVGGRRVATNAASFTKGDIVGVVLDADQGEIVFLRNGIEQGRARGIRGRLYPFVSFDSEQDQITLLGEHPCFPGKAWLIAHATLSYLLASVPARCDACC
jgi:hypothetical protein